MSTLAYDPISGLPSRRRRQPDTDPFGRAGVGLFGAAPSGGRGLSPTGGSYRDLLTIPGTQPDFLGILNADPIFSGLRSNLGAQSVADKAQRDALIRNALAGFGRIPDFGAAGGALGLSMDELLGIANPETRQLAELNTAEGLSTTARLQRERDRAQQNIMDALAGRGALQSGATGVALQDLQQDFKQAEFDAGQQLVQYISEFSRGFAEGERQRQLQQAQGATEAAGRIDPSRLAGTPAREARHIGNGIYQDDQGNFYDVNGNPVAPPAPPPPPPLVPPSAGFSSPQRRAGGGAGGLFQAL